MASKRISNLPFALLPIWQLFFFLALGLLVQQRLQARQIMNLQVEPFHDIQLVLDDFPEAASGKGLVMVGGEESPPNVVSVVDWAWKPSEKAVWIMVYVDRGQRLPLIRLEGFHLGMLSFRGRTRIMSGTRQFQGKWTRFPDFEAPMMRLEAITREIPKKIPAPWNRMRELFL